MNLTRRSFTGLALSVAAGCAGALLSGCEGAAGGGTLRAGVRSDVTGFGYLNERTGNYNGLEIFLVG